MEPSLNELQQLGYLSAWQIEDTSDGEDYKVIFHHGEKFHRDRRARLNRKRPIQVAEPQNIKRKSMAASAPRRGDQYVGAQQSTSESVQPLRVFDAQLVAEFARRGISESKAHELLANLKPAQDVAAQLELIDEMIQNSRIPITNPAGFYVRLIERNIELPDGFETSAQRKTREEAERKERERREREDARQALEWEYDGYCEKIVSRYIEANKSHYPPSMNFWPAKSRGVSFL